jgi:hypothetical protein
MKSTNYYAERILSLLAAIILLQTLYFKFTGAEVSMYIFSKLGAEPYGRIGTGILELIAGGLLLFRRTSLYGAIFGLGIISGAIASHLLILGIDIMGDGGHVFYLALIVFVSCLAVIVLRWSEVKVLLATLLKF